VAATGGQLDLFAYRIVQGGEIESVAELVIGDRSPASSMISPGAGGRSTLCAPAAERGGHGVHPFTMAGMMR
jgi:hypothetical protein